MSQGTLHRLDRVRACFSCFCACVWKAFSIVPFPKTGWALHFWKHSLVVMHSSCLAPIHSIAVLCLSFHFLCWFDLVFVTALFETRSVETGRSCSSVVWLTSPFRGLLDSSLCRCTCPLCGCSVTKKAMLTSLHTDNCVEASDMSVQWFINVESWFAKGWQWALWHLDRGDFRAASGGLHESLWYLQVFANLLCCVHYRDKGGWKSFS